MVHNSVVKLVVAMGAGFLLDLFWNRSSQDAAFAANAETHVCKSVTEEKDYELVRSKTVILKPESVDEAILQMNLVGHQFYMFLNEEHGDISVVYRRNDGGYGLITPEVE